MNSGEKNKISTIHFEKNENTSATQTLIHDF